MLFRAVFLVSLSTISIEILLARIFSISQWNHLSFMVISIALFGFAASGTFLNIFESRKPHITITFLRAGRIKLLVALFSLSALLSFITLNQIPLDYIRLPLEPIQTLYLLITYIVLALPFFFTGLITSIAYSYSSEKSGLLYMASMIGSACGAIIPALFLPIMNEVNLIALSTLIPLILVPFGLAKPLKYVSLIMLSGFMIACFLIPSNLDIFSIRMSPYKALSHILRFPDTTISGTISGLRGRIDHIKSPFIRFAPGMSLKYTGKLPAQWAAYKDGDTPLIFYNLSDLKKSDFSSYALSNIGYYLFPKPETVLVIQKGGGFAIPCAMNSFAKNITVVEQHPELAKQIQTHYDLPVINTNPFSYLKQTDNQFDIIHVENWGTSLPGTSVLSLDNTLTTEGFQSYFKRLSDNGIIIISRKLLLPPSDSIRLWATAYEGLKSSGIKNPDNHIVLLRNWDTFTLLVCAAPIKDTSIIENFASQKNFDVIFFKGIDQSITNRFNVFDQPFHFTEINTLSKAYKNGTEQTYFDNYLLDVSPRPDKCPYPGKFLKWFRLADIYKMTGSRFYSLMMSGEIVVSVVFVEALAVSILLLLLPLLAIRKNAMHISLSRFIFFLSLGAGFMFTELYFIKQFTLLFGDPVISLMVVLSCFLVFSGIGGFISQYLNSRHIRMVLFSLTTCLVALFFLMDALYDTALGLNALLQYALAFIIMMPAGILAGIPFPSGMRHILDNALQRSYAWAANGCTSVLASIAAAQIAVSSGISAILMFSIVAYLLALLTGGRK